MKTCPNTGEVCDCNEVSAMVNCPNQRLLEFGDFDVECQEVGVCEVTGLVQREKAFREINE